MDNLKKFYDLASRYFKQILTEIILPLQNPSGLERLTLERIPVVSQKVYVRNLKM